MYHCRIQFYLTGHKNSVFEIIKAMPPLEHFTHEFIESEGPREDMVANADVILADVQNVDIRENLQMLISGRKKGAELILLARDRKSVV